MRLYELFLTALDERDKSRVLILAMLVEALFFLVVALQLGISFAKEKGKMNRDRKEPIYLLYNNSCYCGSKSNNTSTIITKNQITHVAQ